METLPNLEVIKYRIEHLGLSYQIEILNILVKGRVHINENKTGIRLNVGFLFENHRSVFDEMVRYLEYAEEKETRLDSVEIEKKEISTAFFHEGEEEPRIFLQPQQQRSVQDIAP
jgi:hypothetical protein